MIGDPGVGGLVITNVLGHHGMSGGGTGSGSSCHVCSGFSSAHNKRSIFFGLKLTPKSGSPRSPRHQVGAVQGEFMALEGWRMTPTSLDQRVPPPSAKGGLSQPVSNLPK